MTRKGRYWKLCLRGTVHLWEQWRMAEINNHWANTPSVCSFRRVSMGGNGETRSLWFKEMKLGHVGESSRETYFSLFKEGFSTARLSGWNWLSVSSHYWERPGSSWELDRMEPFCTHEKSSRPFPRLWGRMWGQNSPFPGLGKNYGTIAVWFSDSSPWQWRGWSKGQVWVSQPTMVLREQWLFESWWAVT